MSAPEPQVRVRVLYSPGESLSPGYPWVRHCEGCNERIGYWGTRSGCEYDAAEHENTCPAIQLARLQARWDARDEALRGLVEKWRERADEAAASSDGDVAAAVYYHRYACAGELERAIGGGE